MPLKNGIQYPFSSQRKLDSVLHRSLLQDCIPCHADENRHPAFVENTKDTGFRPPPADSPE
jgi:hypothetical protein